MAKFTILAQYEETALHHAAVEIEADTEAEAIAWVKAQDEAGNIRFYVFQSEEGATSYTVTNKEEIREVLHVQPVPGPADKSALDDLMDAYFGDC